MSDDKKFELTDETKEVDGVTVHRIRALRDTRHTGVGQLGGWVETEANLSHRGDCWVSAHAVAMGGARVYSDALVSYHAVVSGHAQVGDRVSVMERAVITGDANVYGDAYVCGNARIEKGATVSGNAAITGSSVVTGQAHVTGYVSLNRDAVVRGGNIIDGHAHLGSGATVERYDEALSLMGVLPEAVTLYRAANLEGSHRLQVGCQTFRLDSTVAELEALADRHCLFLPPGWKTLRNALLVVVRAWGSRTWDQDA